MSDSADIRSRLSWLARSEGRRRLRRLAWGGVALSAGALALVVVWEWGAPAGLRAWGYGVVALAGLVGVAGLVRAGVGARPDPDEMAEAVERTFPQARGAVRDALEGAAGALGMERVESGIAWLERRGVERVDQAVGEEERCRIARWRAAGIGAVALGVAVAAAQPAAARRATDVVANPTSLWREGTWSVEPGDARIERGGGVEGRARFGGSGREEALVLEWRPAGGAWRAETLAAGPAGRWRWSGLTESRDYRLRYGATTSPRYAIEVEAPFAVVVARARDRDGSWEPLAGRVLPAGEPVEIEGRANRDLESVELEIDGRAVAALSARGATFAGTVAPPTGTGRLRIASLDGATIGVGPFVVAGAGRAWISVVEPAGETVALRGAAAWIEARAGAPAGLAALTWETADGRTGSLGDPGGARDTTVATVVPLGAGRAPGDTVVWRLAAIPVDGDAAATRWRRAVLPVEGELRRDAAAERAGAQRALERALERAGEAARGLGEPEAADRGLRAAADSLARALERTLADPGLGPRMARELRAQRELLDRAASELSPRAGLAPDPEASAEARATILEAVRERMETLERALARSAAADSLERLAEEQRDLARTSRATSPRDLRRDVGPRQRAIDDAAREALVEAAGERAAAEDGADAEGGADPDARPSSPERSAAEAALDAAAEAIRAGAPRPAAEAQERAASEMGAAASKARDEAAAAAAGSPASRAALDRAGAEALFLAERQRALAEEAAADVPPDDAPARQEVVSGGLERTLDAMVAALGGVPAGGGTAEAIGRAVQATAYARRAVRDGEVDAATRRTALDDASDALAGLARALLLPEGSSSASGRAGEPGAEGSRGAAARQLRSLAEAQRALADALGASDEPAGGNPDAARVQREIAEGLARVRRALEEAGEDPAAVDALARSVEETASRLERGLPGARSRTDLRALARRMSDLGRMLDRSREERRSETARPFVPTDPGPLPARATAPRLNAGAAMEAWRSELPLEAIEPARRYLEALEEAGVRAAGPADDGDAAAGDGERAEDGSGNGERPAGFGSEEGSP